MFFRRESIQEPLRHPGSIQSATRIVVQRQSVAQGGLSHVAHTLDAPRLVLGARKPREQESRQDRNHSDHYQQSDKSESSVSIFTEIAQDWNLALLCRAMAFFDCRSHSALNLVPSTRRVLIKVDAGRRTGSIFGVVGFVLSRTKSHKSLAQSWALSWGLAVKIPIQLPEALQLTLLRVSVKKPDVNRPGEALPGSQAFGNGVWATSMPGERKRTQS